MNKYRNKNIVPPLTLAHLSDLHISAEQKGRTIRDARRVIEQVLRQGADHLVVTGDVTANGTPQELELARGLFASYRLLHPERLTVIIGNHDIFGGVHSAEDVLSFPRRCHAVDYDRAVQAFCDAFEDTFAQTISPDPNNRFPFVKVLNEVALVGLNSVARYGIVKNPFGSNGAVERDQFNMLRRVLSAYTFHGVPKIILIHHHVVRRRPVVHGAMEFLWRTIERRTMKLHNRNRLLALFAEQDVRLVLHGHIHENFEYVRRGVHCINSGATVMSTTNALSYRLVHVHGDILTSSVHLLARTATGRPQVRDQRPAATMLRLPTSPRNLHSSITSD